MPKLVPRDRRTSPSLLERILDTPHLPAVVPRLEPEVLHRVIQTCGLHDCGELVALATPAQLGRVFDLDLWRPGRPGAPGDVDTFDAERFGVWLQVLMDCGEAVAADKLQGLDLDLVVTGLARHVAVFDRAAVSRDGHEVGGYLVETRGTGAWDAIAGLLHFLHTEHQAYFHRLMAGCRKLSYSTPEADGFHALLTDREQGLVDLAFARDERREQQGYITSAQSRAFLQLARQVTLTSDAPPARDAVTSSYFRQIAPPTPSSAPDASAGPSAPVTDVDSAVADVVELLRDAGVIGGEPRALLGPGREQEQTTRLARIQAHLQQAHEAGVHLLRTAELAYVANAIVGGCSVQGRPFTEREGADAAMAICNLGLERWPSHWPRAADLVSVFQVGWKVLQDDVAMYAARCLIDALDGVRFDDVEMQRGLDTLRLDLSRRCHEGMPWVAADALDAIATLDMLAWAALVAALAECPVMHAAVGAARRRERAVSPTAFEFISENDQILSIRLFMQSLREMLFS